MINSINKDIEYFFAKTPKLDSTGEKESEDIDDAGTLFNLKKVSSLSVWWIINIITVTIIIIFFPLLQRASVKRSCYMTIR